MEIDGDTKVTDIIDALSSMRFGRGLLTLKIDREARNYLVDALIARRGKG